MAANIPLNSRLKILAYAAGTILLVISLGFVATKIVENWPKLRATELVNARWLLAGFLLYAISHLSTGLAWPLAMRQIGARLSAGDALPIGLVTQIGKYLPGNVAHYVGRGALATQFGIPVKSSGISTAIELGSAIVAMTAVAGVGLLAYPDLLSSFLTTSPTILLVGSVLAVFVITGGLWLLRNGARPTLLLGPIACLGISGTLSGLSLFAVANAFGYSDLPAAAAVSIFAIAWVLGLVVPGSPAGLGVREAALLALLSPIIGGTGAIVISLGHRMLTAAVDALAALVGYAWLAFLGNSKK